MVAAIVAGLTTLIVVGSQEKLYTSSSLIRIHYAPDDDVVAGAPGGQDLRDNPVIADSIVFMSSRSFLRMVAEEQELFADPEFRPQLDAGEVSNDLSTDQERQLRSAAIDALAERLVVAQRGGSHVISVEMTSNNPEKAARIANAAVEIFIDKELSRLEKMEQRYVDWLTARIRDSRGQLAGLEGKVLALSSELGSGELQQEPFISQAANVQWTELTTQLANTRAQRAAIQVRYENALSWAENHGVDASLAIAKSPVLDELRNLETALVRRLSELGGDLGTRHPSMINLRNELKLTRERMQEEAGSILIKTQNDLLISSAREAEIEAKIAKLNQVIIEQQDQYAEIREIKHDISNRQAQLEIMTEKMLRIDESRMVRRGLSDIMSPAKAQYKHNYPDIWPLIAYASLGAILVSLMAIFFHDRWVSDFGFTSQRDLRALDISPIGIVPELRTHMAYGKSIENHVVTRPHTAEAEAIQRVRNHLLKLRPSESAAATVVTITSSSPQEGKTMMALALARQAAIAGSRVLCIDADFRHPSIANLIGLETTAGLSELLTGDTQNIPRIRRDPHTALQVLQAGSYVENPADLLTSKRMVRLMEELRQHYDWIFVDSPSLGAVSDSMILAKHADLVVYVARWLATTRNVVQMGIDQLRSVGVNSIGVALTRVSMNSYQKYEQMEEFRYYGYSSNNA